VQLLERFWFDSDAQKSPIELLSGGERRRLQLVLTLAAKPNVLLLDEPTNDLDLDTLRALEDFLDDWPGAAVVISHDRTFLDRTVNDVLVIDEGRARRWVGGYAGWLSDREGATNIRTLDTSGGSKPVAEPRERAERNHRSRSTVRHELKTAEKDMARLEKRVAVLRDELDDAGTDHETLARVGSALAEEEAALTEAEERWLERTAELEEIDGRV
jgi:ATP-binding cassette subfamily F protein uup